MVKREVKSSFVAISITLNRLDISINYSITVANFAKWKRNFLLDPTYLLFSFATFYTGYPVYTHFNVKFITKYFLNMSSNIYLFLMFLFFRTISSLKLKRKNVNNTSNKENMEFKKSQQTPVHNSTFKKRFVRSTSALSNSSTINLLLQNLPVMMANRGFSNITVCNHGRSFSIHIYNFHCFTTSITEHINTIWYYSNTIILFEW